MKSSSQKSVDSSQKAEAPLVYDADAQQRFAFEIIEGAEKFETAHIFNSLGDERYLQYLKDGKIEGNEDEVKEEVQAATVSLWRDLVDRLENVEIEGDSDFRDLVDVENEIIPAMGAYLAIAIVEPEVVVSGVRKLSADNNLKVITEAYFNGKPIQQTHILSRKTQETSKTYDRICKNEYKQERMGGGLKLKPRTRFVPQVKAKGELYDQMAVSHEGFKGRVPVRFKATVIDYIFASTLQQKK